MLTRTKLPELHEDRLDQVTLARPAGRVPLARWLTEDGAVGRHWPRIMMVAWVAALAAAVVLEPAPADPEAPAPLWASLLFLATFAALGATAAGLARRQRMGLVASVVAGGLALFASVMCPVSGHHASIGAWWYLQMTAFTALIGASLVGLRRSRA